MADPVTGDGSKAMFSATPLPPSVCVGGASLLSYPGKQQREGMAVERKSIALRQAEHPVHPSSSAFLHNFY